MVCTNVISVVDSLLVSPEVCLLRSRRDATRVIYEILSLGTVGVSKTSIIFKVNLSHKLVEGYITFLVKKHLLEVESDLEGTRFFLSERGERLLELLREVEKELDDFYTIPLLTALETRGQASRTRSIFGSERGRVPIEIQRASSF
jgi:predicted transcriptional regulator